LIFEGRSFATLAAGLAFFVRWLFARVVFAAFDLPDEAFNKAVRVEAGLELDAFEATVGWDGTCIQDPAVSFFLEEILFALSIAATET
jgi:hypothetical protein